MNKEFILRLAEHMETLRHEDHYNQQCWSSVIDINRPATACNTAGCLAGHAAILGGFTLDPENDCAFKDHGNLVMVRDIVEVAAELMGVATYSCIFTGFAESRWPEAYGDALRTANEAVRVARVCRRRLPPRENRPSGVAARLLRAAVEGNGVVDGKLVLSPLGVSADIEGDGVVSE